MAGLVVEATAVPGIERLVAVLVVKAVLVRVLRARVRPAALDEKTATARMLAATATRSSLMRSLSTFSCHQPCVIASNEPR